MRSRILFLTAVLLGGVALAVVLGRGPGELRVDVLDVGQGDGILIRTPGGHQILVDGGPDRSALRAVGRLLPFWDRSLDLVVVTHPQFDHYGGLIPVLERYRAERLLWNGEEATGSDWTEFERVAQRDPKVVTDHDLSYDFGDGVHLTLLFPRHGFRPREIQDPNDGAIVLRLEYGSASMLLTSDAGPPTESQLLASGKLRPVEVLKVGHHGSRFATTDAFLAQIHPRLAAISVGAKNTYGHPAPLTLQKLKETGVRTYRTDKDGTVEFRSYAGEHFTVRTHALQD